MRRVIIALLGSKEAKRKEEKMKNEREESLSEVQQKKKKEGKKTIRRPGFFKNCQKVVGVFNSLI